MRFTMRTVNWLERYKGIKCLRNCLIISIYFPATIVAVSVSYPQSDFGFPDDVEVEQRQTFDNGQPNRPRPMFNNFPPITRAPSTTVVNIPMQSTTQATITTRSPAYRSCLANNCPTTNEYNPVCGTDDNNYDNRQKLDCANFCGPRVDPNWQRKASRFQRYFVRKLMMEISFFNSSCSAKSHRDV